MPEPKRDGKGQNVPGELATGRLCVNGFHHRRSVRIPIRMRINGASANLVGTSEGSRDADIHEVGVAGHTRHHPSLDPPRKKVGLDGETPGDRPGQERLPLDEIDSSINVARAGRAFSRMASAAPGKEDLSVTTDIVDRPENQRQLGGFLDVHLV